MSAANANSEDVVASGDNGGPSLSYISCLYFGYASNLSPTTMKQRCPGSLFVGLAVLKDWKWIINSTRYANLVQSPGDVVYGSLYFLMKRDEDALDISEGVPWMYEKKHLTVTRLSPDGKELTEGARPEVEAMTYIDMQRTDEGNIEADYVVWIKKGITEGVQIGMPQWYADKYLAPHIPPDERDQEIIMVRTLHSQVYSTTNLPLYNKTRSKDPNVAKAYEGATMMW